MKLTLQAPLPFQGQKMPLHKERRTEDLATA